MARNEGEGSGLMDRTEAACWTQEAQGAWGARCTCRALGAHGRRMRGRRRSPDAFMKGVRRAHVAHGAHRGRTGGSLRTHAGRRVHTWRTAGAQGVHMAEAGMVAGAESAHAGLSRSTCWRMEGARKANEGRAGGILWVRAVCAEGAWRAPGACMEGARGARC